MTSIASAKTISTSYSHAFWNASSRMKIPTPNSTRNSCIGLKNSVWILRRAYLGNTFSRSGSPWSYSIGLQTSSSFKLVGDILVSTPLLSTVSLPSQLCDPIDRIQPKRRGSPSQLDPLAQNSAFSVFDLVRAARQRRVCFRVFPPISQTGILAPSHISAVSTARIDNLPHHLFKSPPVSLNRS